MTRFVHLLAITVITLAIGSGCSSSSDPGSTGTVTMGSVVENSTITQYISKPVDRVEGGVEPDSVRVERVRMLVSRLKFHSNTADSGDDGNDVKVGPVVVTFQAGTTTSVFSSEVPAGIYDRMKIEKHKFSASEAEDYINDPVFGEFAAPERLTLIMEGSVFIGGQEQAFTITDDATENLWVDFAPAVDVADGGTVNLDLIFDGDAAFLGDANQVLNPFEPRDLRDITKNLKDALRAQNK